MIVIEPVGTQVPLPQRPRWPGKIQLPVLIPPSPEGTDRPLAPRKSKAWLWLLAAGFVGLVYSGQNPSPKRRKKPSSSARKLSGAAVGYFITPLERKRGQKLLYMWQYPGQQATMLSKYSIEQFKPQSDGERGDLYPVWAYTADHARELIKAGAVEPYRSGQPDPLEPARFTEERRAKEDLRKSVEEHPDLPRLDFFFFWKPWGSQRIRHVTEDRVARDPLYFYAGESEKRGRLYKVAGDDHKDALRELEKRLYEVREKTKELGPSAGKRIEPFKSNQMEYDGEKMRKIGTYRQLNETPEHYQRREAIERAVPTLTTRAAAAPGKALTKAQKRHQAERDAAAEEIDRQRAEQRIEKLRKAREEEPLDKELMADLEFRLERTKNLYEQQRKYAPTTKGENRVRQFDRLDELRTRRDYLQEKYDRLMTARIALSPDPSGAVIERKLQDYWFFIPWKARKPRKVGRETLKRKADYYYTAEQKKEGKLYRVTAFHQSDATNQIMQQLKKASDYRKKVGGKHNPHEPPYYAWKRDQGYRIVRPPLTHLDFEQEAMKKARERQERKDRREAARAAISVPPGGEKGIKSRTDEVIREMEEYLAKIEREKAKRVRTSKESPPPEPAPPEQLTLFGYPRDLAGRIMNCAIWIPAERGTGWKCGFYGRVCDSPTCETSPDPKKRQTKVCVKTQKVFSPFLNKKVERCKRYEATCEGPACMPMTMPYPEEPSREEPAEDAVRSMAEWMAEQYNEEHFGKIPYLAREILDRGGISPPKRPTGLEKRKRSPEEYTAIPLFLRNKKGMPLDEIAAEMGYKYEDDLRMEILKAYPPKEKGAWKKIQRKTWRDFEADARWEIQEKIYAGEWDGLSGLAGAPASVWKTTMKEFAALQRDKDPDLPNELNWMLQRSKVSEVSDYLRVFKGAIPGHMAHRLKEWLWDRHYDPKNWPPPGKIKEIRIIDEGSDSSMYIIVHPFYRVRVRFYRSGNVQVVEDRSSYHGDSVHQAILEGKPVPKKVLKEYAPFIPLARQVLELKPGAALPKVSREPEQLRLLGQELFPELRRELVMKEPEDPATSDDPVTACMERLGWRIPRMEELRASIAEKMVPDLFTGKTVKLSAGEKEYQRVISQCLKKSSGIADLLGHSMSLQSVRR